MENLPRIFNGKDGVRRKSTQPMIDKKRKILRKKLEILKI